MNKNREQELLMEITMPRMIPPTCEGSQSPGEPLVFRALNYHCPAEWTVLYSLDIASWCRNIQREIDFLVLIPNLGILCIEVKGHAKIEVIDGMWHLGNERKREGPFQQADNARHVLRKRIDEKFPELKGVPIHKCVIFPLASFDLPPNIAIHDFEFLDREKFEACIKSKNLPRFIETCLTGWIRNDQRWQDSRSFSENSINPLIEFLRPTIRYEPTFKKTQEQAESELNQILRDQQKPVLNLVEDNPRVIVDGGAGTGKTLIAKEVARQLTKSHRRVGIFCHQELIGRKIEKEMGIQPGIVAGRLSTKLEQMLNITRPDDVSPDDPEWINITLPEKLIELLDCSDQSQEVDPDNYRFDAIVLDEAQDILARPQWWDVVARLLRGGLKDGVWFLFGDFKYQVLVDGGGRQAMNDNLNRLKTESRPVSWRLRENCRNKAYIGNSARSYAHLEGWRDIYDGFLHTSGTPKDVRTACYQQSEQQINILADEVAYWRQQGYQWDHLTILSACADGGTATQIKKMADAGRLAELQRRLSPFRDETHGLKFGYVDDFKGMENKIIILTDIDLTSEADCPELRKNLFYTGMTRSLDAVSVIWSNRTKEWIANLNN